MALTQIAKEPNSLKKENHSARSGVILDSCVRFSEVCLLLSPQYHTSEHHQADANQRECSQFRDAWCRASLIEILGLVQATCTFRVIGPIDGCIVLGVIIDSIAALRTVIVAASRNSDTG